MFRIFSCLDDLMRMSHNLAGTPSVVFPAIEVSRRSDPSYLVEKYLPGMLAFTFESAEMID